MKLETRRRVSSGFMYVGFASLIVALLTFLLPASLHVPLFLGLFFAFLGIGRIVEPSAKFRDNISRYLDY